jgi:hypothetical protein
LKKASPILRSKAHVQKGKQSQVVFIALLVKDRENV